MRCSLHHHHHRWPLPASAYISLLKPITATRLLPHGKALHAHLLKSPLTPSLLLLNALLNMYCKCSAMPSAHHLFAQMPLHDAGSYNSLISGYTSLGSFTQAISTFVSARHANSCDRYTYAAALRVCACSADLHTGRLVHSLIVVGGFRGVFVTNSLMDMYAKCGRIEEVRRVFERSRERDSVTWNTLISACDRMGTGEEALGVFGRMQRAGESMSCFTIGSVLRSCSRMVGSEGVGKMVHCCVVKAGLDGDLYLGSALVDMYSKNHGLEDAVKVFMLVRNPNVVVFNTLLAGIGRSEFKDNELAVGALDMFSDMRRRGMKPSKFTFSSVLKVCILSMAFEFGKQVHGLVIKSNLQADEVIGSSLIDLYMNAGSIEDGLRCFSSVPKKDVVTWTSMISGCVQNEQFERALGLFHDLLAHGIGPDLFSLSIVMSACAHLAVARTGAQIQSYALKCGFDRFTAYSNSQIFMYSRSGDIDAAERTFEEMECHDVVSCSEMITSHAHHGCAKDALTVFKKMEDSRIAPNEVTFVGILTACSHGGLVDEGLTRYFGRMKRDYGVVPNVKHYTCIVDLLGRAGKLDNAEKFILESPYDDDPVLWRSLLGSCRIHKDMDRGTRVAVRLMNLDPNNSSSYVLPYNMYLDAGRLSLANKTRDLMKERGVKKEPGQSWIEMPTSVHSFVVGDRSHPKSVQIYAKLEEMLSKIGRISYTAADVVDSDEPNVETKQTLLNCHSEKLAVALGMIDLPKSAPIRVMKNLRVCNDCHTTMKLLSKSEGREIVLRDPIRFHRFRGGSCNCGDFW